MSTRSMEGVGADDIISDNDSDGISDGQISASDYRSPVRTSANKKTLPDYSSHSDIASLDGRESPDLSPLRNSRASKGDLGFAPGQRRSNRDLMGEENVRKESLHLTDPSMLSDEELSQEDSFADANSNEIVTDDEMSISDGEIDDEDDEDYDDDFDEDGNYRYSGEDDEYEYHEMVYESDDEITVEDALATIMEGEEEEEEEEEEESDDESTGDRRNGSIHQSLYRFALLNEEEDEEEDKPASGEMPLGGESKSPPKRARPQGEFVEEEGVMMLNDGEEGEMELNDEGEMELNDSGYFLSKEPLYSSMESGTLNEDENNNIVSLLRAENWKALTPFLYQLQTAEQEDQILVDFTKMDTFGNRKMYPIHFIVWRAPNSFIKTFISSIPYMYQSETLSRLDSHGNSPLHLACSGLEVDFEMDMIDVSVVEIISECGPETHEMLNKQGESPLALLMSSKALKADPENLANSEATAERLVRSMLEGRTHLIKRKNMFDFKTLLHTATSCGVHEGVAVALLELSDPSIAVMRDTKKQIPLHYVAGCVSGKRPQVRIAEKLVEAQKAGVVQTTTTGETPLHIFVSNIMNRIKDEEELNSSNVAKMTEILMGSKEDESKCSLFVKNSADLSPLHCCAVYDAPKNVMEEFTKSPFFEKAALVTDSNGAAPLHLACASSKIRATLETLKCFGTAEAAVVRDMKSRTPMHVAAENPKMTKQFIKALAEINPKAGKVRNSKGRMPLHVAIRKNAKDSVIRALLKVNPKAVKTTFGNRNCIFHEMCEFKTSASIMKSMLKMYPEGCKVKNKSGNLPLHDAIAFECSIDVVQELLDAYPGGATVKNKNGDTPLHLAATQKSLEIVELVISVGPKACIYANKDGLKPLDVAKSVEGNEEVVTFMEAEITEYLEERARQKAKSKERKGSSSKERRRKRSSRAKSESEDVKQTEELKDVDKEDDPAPKKPSSLSKIMGRSSVSKQKRRASGGDVKTVDPETKQDKRPLRRMLKSFAKVTSPLSGGKKSVASDASTEKKADEKKEKKSSSSHSRNDRRGPGLSRSKSATGLGKSADESISEESNLRTKLKQSRSFRSPKKKLLDDGEEKDSSPKPKKSFFGRKSKSSGAADDDGDAGSKEESPADEPTTSPTSGRKIRSGRKRESKSSSTHSSLVSPGASTHKSPKRGSKHGKKLTSESLEEDPNNESNSSLVTPGDGNEAENSHRSLESSDSSRHKRKKKSPKRRRSKPDIPIKEEEKPASESSVSKHASESLETKNTAESSKHTSDSVPLDQPPSDPPANDEHSVDTEDEWF